MFRRPPSKARIQWRVWMPWYEFSRLVGELQDHDEAAQGAMTAAVLVVAGTLGSAFVLPAWGLPIIIAGGLLIVGLLTAASADGARLAAGLRGARLPAPRALLRIGARLVVDDARMLWHGRRALDVAPTPLLLEGEIVDDSARGTGGLDHGADTRGDTHREQPHD